MGFGLMDGLLDETLVGFIVVVKVVVVALYLVLYHLHNLLRLCRSVVHLLNLIHDCVEPLHMLDFMMGKVHLGRDDIAMETARLPRMELSFLIKDLSVFITILILLQTPSKGTSCTSHSRIDQLASPTPNILITHNNNLHLLYKWAIQLSLARTLKANTPPLWWALKM